MADLKFAPALTDDERINLLPDHDPRLAGSVRTYADQHALKGMRNVEQAVLARVGTVRDQALQEAAAKMDARYNAVTGSQQYDKGRRDAYDVAESDILALKGTPAAAVADEFRKAVSRLVLCAHNVGQAATPAMVAVLASAARNVAEMLAQPIPPQPSTNPIPLAAVERDAARYQWLRATTGHASCGDQRIDVRNRPGDWDRAIDAAIAASKGNGNG